MLEEKIKENTGDVSRKNIILQLKHVYRCNKDFVNHAKRL